MTSPKQKSNSVAKGAFYPEGGDAQVLEVGEEAQDLRILVRRADMLRTRQLDLDILMDRHDDLVREAFHLDKFVTLLAYEPKVAKQDTSQVFLEYKAPHDLISKSAEISAASNQLPRKTRRATTELRHSVAATISAGPSTPPTTPSPSKGKLLAPRTEPILSGTKKLKMSSKMTGFPDRPSSLFKGKGKAAELTDLQDSNITNDMMRPPSSMPKRSHHRRAKNGPGDPTPEPSTPGIASTSSNGRGSKRKRPSSSSLDSGRRESRRLNADDTKPESPSPESGLPLKPPKSTVKRIRLFQRPPPAVHTHPSQIPSRPQYDGSIQRFLQSYLSLEDGIDVTQETLDHTSLVEAKTRARIRELRREGRLMLNIPDLPDCLNGMSKFAMSEGEHIEPTREENHYDHLLLAATDKGRSIASEYVVKRSIAKRVSKLVMAWHGNRETTEEKQRKAEALRMKALAKFTAKEVEKQWKKAVMAVHEQKQAILDAEAVRAGKKHLDDILDQSGIILEAQHFDLTKTRSRSSSARDWSDSESDGTDTAGREDDENLDTETDVSEGEDVDASLLLVDARDEIGSRDLSSEVETESAVREDDAVVSDVPSPRDTPGSTSEGSLFTPILTDTLLPLSGTSSDSAMDRDDEHPSIGARTAFSPVLVAAASVASGDENDSSRERVSEPPSLVICPVAGNPNSTTHNMDDVNSTLVPSTKGYRSDIEPAVHSISRIPSSPLPPPSNESALKEPSSDVHALPATHLASDVSSPNIPPTSPSPPIPSPAPLSNGIASPDGRQTVAIRLSNGVVIYRDSNATSAETHTVEDDSTSLQLPNGQRWEITPLDLDLKPDLEPCGITPVVTNPRSEYASDAIEADPQDAKNEHTSNTPTDKQVTEVRSTALSSGQQADVDPIAIPASPDASEEEELQVAPHLVDFAAASVQWDPTSKVGPPSLLRGNLRPYQQSGLEWLASLHTNNLNGILADEMGLGKTIQTIALLAHLACDQGIWGPHLIVVPTSVLLNWEMEFKKFLPGFKILPYHGSTKRRKELRVGWNNKHSFNVCVTSYTLASRDAHIFKRKAWYYMILDEAHMIKNFKSQRWNILLMFRSFRRLLLTGTPLQNNLTELWALLQFLMSGTNFANLKEFGDWFSNPLEKAIEQGTVMDEETQERVRKLHTVLRPYLLRRLKADVEKELPRKFEHLVICRLSKRQRFLYDEFMSRAQTKDALSSGVYHKVANILMQLRKVCNHPDLFEVRPIVTSFAMPRSAIIDFEIKELLVRRRLLQGQDNALNLDLLGLLFIQHQGRSMMQARSTSSLDASSCLPFVAELPGEPPPKDTRTVGGYKSYIAYQRQMAMLRQWTQIAYINRLRCAASPVYGSETISVIRRLYNPPVPLSEVDFRRPDYLDRSSVLPTLVKSYVRREAELDGFIYRFAFITPPVVARDLPSIALLGAENQILHAQRLSPELDTILHRTSVKLQIAFPDASLVQYDCGKLQELASLLRTREAGGHRVLIFTQMTKVLDILEIFLNFHGYRYLRLDGATKIEDRQYITERFNNDARVFAFIASSRSGGVGINLTGADTVIFYDSDFNPQMDRQCEDRAHRIGQIRDVHIYRFISEHTVEESMLRKANQKRSLDNIVIQQGEFDWRSLLIDDEAFGKALEEFEDKEDAYAARVAAREEAVKEVEDRADFAAETEDGIAPEVLTADLAAATAPVEEEVPEEEGTIVDYMLAFVNRDWEWFSTWRL